MFDPDAELQEEEWSLSAKHVGGLVLNPFSSPNQHGNRLFNWFMRTVTGDATTYTRWSAKPEYLTKQRLQASETHSRNDWRLHVHRKNTKLKLVVECKFCKGINLKKDCLGYFSDGCDLVVIIATLSEFSRLSCDCACSSSVAEAEEVRERVACGRLYFMPWHEVVAAAAQHLPENDAGILEAWAGRVAKGETRLIPGELITGSQVMSSVASGTALNLPVTHKPDARGELKSTATIEQIIEKVSPPDWVPPVLRALVEKGQQQSLAVELKIGDTPKRRPAPSLNFSWVNFKAASSNRKVTVLVFSQGLAVLVAHPRPGRSMEPFSAMTLAGLTIGDDLKRCGLARDNRFPWDTTGGIEWADPVDAKFVFDKVIQAIGLL